MESLKKHFSNDLDRRQFLKHSTAATLAALTGSAPRLLGSEAGNKIKPSADTLILLWMAGGMAQTETFDPKGYTPYESGLESKRVLSTFPSIPTAVDGINLSQGLERLAKVMDRGTLIRSHLVADLGIILHSRHQYHWHTGYEPPQTVAVPTSGALIARQWDARTQTPRFHRHWPEPRDRRKSDSEGVPHRRFSRHRVRAVHYLPIPRRGGRRAHRH